MASTEFPEHWLTALEEGYASAKTCEDAAKEIRRLRAELETANAAWERVEALISEFRKRKEER